MASTESAGASHFRLAWHVGGLVWMLVMMTCAEHPQLWPRQSPPTPPLGLFQSQCPTALCLLATAQGRVTCRQSTPPLLSSNITGTAMLLTNQHLITCHSRLYIPIILGEAMFSMHEQDCLFFMVMSLQPIFSRSSHAACTVLVYASKHCTLLPATLVCTLHLFNCVKLPAALSHVSAT